MKYLTYLALIGVASAVKIAKEGSSLASLESQTQVESRIRNMSLDDLQKLVDQAVQNAKLNESKVGGE